MLPNRYRFLLSLLFVGAATGLALISVPAATVGVCAVILAVLYPKLESVIEFSFGPLKAKLERSISESEQLLQDVRSLAVTTARVAASTAARSGRKSPPTDWAFRATKELEGHLLKLGASDHDLFACRQDIVRFGIRDLGVHATWVSTYTTNTVFHAEREMMISEGEVADPGAVESFLRRYEAL